VGHLLLQPGGGDGEEDVQVLPLVLHPGLGRDGLEGSAEAAYEAVVVAEVLLDAAVVVHPVAVPAQDHLSPSMAVEAVPVMPLIRQHVLCREAVSIFLHPSLVTLRTHFLMQLHQVVLHCKVQEPLGGLLVQLVVPVHVPGEAGQSRNLLLGSHSLDPVPYYLGFVRVTHSPDFFVKNSH